MLDDYPKVQPGPPKPSKIIQPQVFSLPRGTERYVVEGQGAVLIPLETGDHLTVINDEGGQPCEIVVCDPKGRSDTGILGVSSGREAGGLKALLTSTDQSLRGLRMGLDARKIDIATAQAIHLFEATTPAKSEAGFTAARDGTVIIAAPSPKMDFDAQNTATSLTVMVKRATVKLHTHFALPDPLADPLADIRVHTQTASDIQRVGLLPIREMAAIAVPFLHFQLKERRRELLAHRGLQLGVRIIGAQRVQHVER